MLPHSNESFTKWAILYLSQSEQYFIPGKHKRHRHFAITCSLPWYICMDM